MKVIIISCGYFALAIYACVTGALMVARPSIYVKLRDRFLSPRPLSKLSRSQSERSLRVSGVMLVGGGVGMVLFMIFHFHRIFG